jgi:hypothetical protein
MKKCIGYIQTIMSAAEHLPAHPTYKTYIMKHKGFRLWIYGFPHSVGRAEEIN